jgi:hypothetical protein
MNGSSSSSFSSSEKKFCSRAKRGVISPYIQREPFDVPQEQLTIARHFNAGSNQRWHQVPEGRLNIAPRPFSRPCGTYLGAAPYPALKRRAIFGKSLRDFVLTALVTVVVLFSILAANAQTTNNRSDAEIEGSQLAHRLLASRPTTNYFEHGVLTIRDGSGKRSEIDLSSSVETISTGWENIYGISIGSKPVTNGLLIINHDGSDPGKYDLYSEGELKSRIVTLQGNQTMIPFAGSDFWLCDLGLEFFHWPQQKVLKKEFHRQCACTVLESTNPNPSANSYSRVVCWIDQDSLGIVEAYAYDVKGNKLKNFYPKNLEKVNGQYQLESMVMENLQTGSKSVMEFDLDK